jgi:response regulator NasT
MALSLRILVVEDEGAQAQALRLSLERLGHQVVAVCAEGSEACRLRAELQPDLVLMDLGLRGMDGLEAAARMNRASPLPVIIVTALADRRFLAAAREAGVYGYLLKPVEESLLGPAIEAAWQGFQRVRDLEQEVADLRQEIRTRKLVGRAVGIVMERLGMGEKQARRHLEAESRRQGLSLAQVAESVIAAEERERRQPPHRPRRRR